jgi:hypothetical protein
MTERLLLEIVPNAYCIPQEWDHRLDCLVRLPDGTAIGEMIDLSELTEERIIETGRRLRNRAEGGSEPLIQEIHSPRRIVSE